MELPTLPLLKNRIKFWRQVLNLKRWEITISYASIEEDEIAYITPRKRLKTAHILFNENEKYKTTISIYYDFILVHELMHAIFANMRLEQKVSTNETFAKLEEYICDFVAGTLCRVHNLPVLYDGWEKH